jgi:hypothetical protein
MQQKKAILALMCLVYIGLLVKQCAYRLRLTKHSKFILYIQVWFESF